MASHGDTIATAPVSGRANLLSLSDELLARIIRHILGRIVFDSEVHIYTTAFSSECSSEYSTRRTHLRILRRVCKRLSRLAKMELFRVPNTMKANYSGLTDLNRHITHHSIIAQSAEVLSLEGTADFFLDVLEQGYPKLASLALVFSAGRHSEEDLVDLFSLDARMAASLRHTSLSKLRIILQRLPLVRLHVVLRSSLDPTQNELYKAIELGAGHSTLHYFFIDSLLDPDWAEPWDEDLPIQPSHHTSDIISLSFRGATKLGFGIVEAALGRMPRLDNLEVSCDDSIEDSSLTLSAISPSLARRIRRLQLESNVLSAKTWHALVEMPKLRELRLVCHDTPNWTSGPDLKHADARMPRLQSICTWTTPAIQTAILRKAAQRNMFPSLMDLDREDATIWTSPPQAYGRVLEAYDQLVAVDAAIRIHPADLRERLSQYTHKKEKLTGLLF